MRIGILGGTFNPVHQGHLLLAQGALQAVPLDLILWVPAHLPPHKPVEPKVSAEDRARMVELAIDQNPSFQLSRVELDRPAPSYTLDTVRQLKKESLHPDAQWFFLVGSDSAAELPTWHKSSELLSEIPFLVIPRPGAAKGSTPAGVTEIPVKTIPLCASEIREKIRQDKSIRGLVPEAVRRYIEERGLYR